MVNGIPAIKTKKQKQPKIKTFDRGERTFYSP